MNFTVNDSKKQEIELKPNGANIPVTKDNLDEYLNLLQKFYLYD